MLPQEQKGCRKRTKGTGDLLFIDKMILKEVKNRKKNSAMCWIDYRKAYDLIPHSWILECLMCFGISEEICNLLEKSMKSWCVELTCGENVLGQVNIRRGILQGDSLSPLLFIISLIPLTMILNKTKHGYQFSTNGQRINHLLYMDDLKLYSRTEKELNSLAETVRIFSKDINMEFGIQKCPLLVLKRGKSVKTEGIQLQDNSFIRSLEYDENYKYLGVLQANEVNGSEMKKIVGKEYKRRVRKVFETKLNGNNLISAINIWAVPVIRYSAPFLDWNKEELQTLDRTTRKLLTSHNALHPRSNVDRIYLPRDKGGKGLKEIEDTVAEAVIDLHQYVNGSEEKILIAARKVREINEEETVTDFKMRKQNERRERWKDKTLHGQYLRQTENVAEQNRWMWLKKAGLKRETESLIMAAQEQAIRTNLIKSKIDKSQQESKCRMCGDSDESINHILNECKMLAQKDYKKRHDWVGRRIHWEVCRKYNIDVSEKWYNHEPVSVLDNGQCTLLWDFTIQTDNEIKARRPDMIIKDKEKNTCIIIDFTVSYDNRIELKEKEKIDKYRDLAIELKRLWKTKVTVVPIVFGSLGAIPKKIEKRLKDIGIDTNLADMHKTAILNSARILRMVLET